MDIFIVFMLKKMWTGVIIQHHDTVILSVLNQTTHHNHENIIKKYDVNDQYCSCYNDNK